MISFDVKDLFNNVPLDETIDFIFKKVYDEKKIQTNIPKTVLKGDLYICTKQLHFTFNNNIYIQCDGVAMGSPLGPLLANIFMTSLQEDLTPTLKSCFCNWKRYVDDAHFYVEPTKVEFILNKLNNYHPHINFTFEMEKNNEINLLGVLIKRVNNNKLETGVYRKPTSTDIYIIWNAHAPTEWKIGTLRNLIKRAKLICSDESLVKEEMKYLTNVFHEVNDYPMSIINTIAQQELNDSQSKNRRAETNETSNKIQLNLSYSRKHGKKLTTKMKKYIRKTLPENVLTIVT